MAAGNNSSAMKEFCDIAECSICLKTLIDPRMLPCIHTFCFRCLEKIVKKTNRKPGVEMPCPLCRREFTIPEKGIRELQKNFMMTKMIEVTTAFNQGQSSGNIGPGPNIARVTTRCVNCRERPDLCDSCLIKEKKSQKVATDQGTVGTKGGAEVGAIIPNCKIHREKQLDVYCSDCKKVVCVSCLYESHRSHDWKDVKTEQEEFSQVIRRNVTKLKRFVAELSRKQNSLETKEDFLQRIDLIETEILAKSKKLKALIDRHTNILIETLASIKNDHLKQMHIEEEELEFRQTVLTTFGRFCDELRSKASAADICRCKDDLIQRTEELEKEHETFVLRPDHCFEISFNSFNIIDVLKKHNSNIIGELKGEVLQKNTYLIVNGSRESDNSSTTTDLLQVSLDHPHNVSSLQEMPIKVKAGCSAAVYNDTMFITGIGDSYKEIWKYSLSSAWANCGSLLQDRLWHCTQFVGKQLFIFGGCPYLPVVTTVWRGIEAFSLVKKACEPVGKLKYGVKVAACVAYKDSIFVFGGMTGDQKDLDCVQVYNTLNKTVTVLSTSMPRVSRLMRGVVCGKHAVLMGQHTCFIFHFEDETWEERNQFKTDVSYFGLVLQNERIFVFGGCSTVSDQDTWSDELKYVSVLSVFKDEFVSWKTATKLPKPTMVQAYGMVHD